MEKYLEAGKIINTHGVDGRVKLEHWCDSPDVLAGLKTLYFKRGNDFSPRSVLYSAVMGRFVLVQLEEITSLEDAIKLKNTVVYADRDDLPLEEGAHFISDLIGLNVFHADNGELLGRLTGVRSSTASQLYEIQTDKGTALVPAVAEFVISIDLDRGIFIRPIEGLLDL